MIVLDSSIIIAHWNPRDVHHDQASDIMKQARAGRWGRILLPEYVVLEILTVLGRIENPSKAATLGRLLMRQRDVEVLPCTRYLPEALGIFRKQDSMDIGLIDATLVAIARRLEDPNIATFDRAIAARDDVRTIPNT